MAMQKLLILSSNPRRDLNLDRETSDLHTAITRLGNFEVGLGLGVRAQELSELLAEHSPQFVHFCGHGAGEKGLVFQHVVDLINHRPRKSLNYRTPYEVFYPQPSAPVVLQI
jgi:hypothetical protein